MGQHNYFWNIEYEGEDYDLEMSCKDSAVNYAEELFIEDCESEGGFENGETREREVEAVRFYFNSEGDKVEVERTSETLFFEHYHGDAKEHGYP